MQVFINAPHVLHPVDLDGAVCVATKSDPTSDPRAWWKFNADLTGHHGLDKSLLYMMEVLKADRYDVR